jgi:hypothetical protein
MAGADFFQQFKSVYSKAVRVDLDERMRGGEDERMKG